MPEVYFKDAPRISVPCFTWGEVLRQLPMNTGMAQELTRIKTLVTPPVTAPRPLEIALEIAP